MDHFPWNIDEKKVDRDDYEAYVDLALSSDKEHVREAIEAMALAGDRR